MLISTLLATAAMTVDGTLPPEFEQKAQAMLEHAYDADGPGAAVIVVDDGEVVYHAGRGMADVEKRVPITTDTVFRYASITKQFTAATILQLVAEGKVSLDAPLTDYVPDYPRPAGDATVRQLLNHTSGIQSYTSIPGFMIPANTVIARTTAEMIDVFDDAAMPAAHGARLEYNNSGYILLGAIIENVTGKDWYAAVRDRIAKPLGLTSLTSGIHEAEIPAMAKGYTGAEGKVTASQPIHMSLPHAAGALVGTVGDLATWAGALHSGRVIPDAQYAEMIAPSHLADGSEVPFGFGLVNAEVRGTATIGHSGGIFGFSTDSLYVPSEDLFVAVLANSDAPQTNVSVLMRRLAALAIDNPFPEYESQPLDLDALGEAQGRYRFDDTVRDLMLIDGKLYTKREGSSQLEVKYAGDDTYYYGPDSATFFTLVRTDSGPEIRFHSEGAEKPSVGTRVGDLPTAPEDIRLGDADRAALVGTYDLPIGPFTVGEKDGRMTGKLGPQDEITLQSYAPDRLAAPQFGAELVFQIEDGRAVSMTLQQGGQEFVGNRRAE